MIESLTEDIAVAIAEADEIDPLDMEYVLQEYVDMDALAQFATYSKTSWTLSFELPNHEVTVTSDGSILVDGTQQNRWQ